MKTYTNHGASIPLPEKIVHHYTCALMEKVLVYHQGGRVYLSIEPHKLMLKNCTCGAEERSS